MVVLPVPRDSVVMMSESNNNTVDFASIPSGNSTIIAMMIPTNSLGAPTAATADSRLGASDLASKTTATRQTINNPALHQATLFDGLGACTPSSLTATSGKK